uniref:Uncharacterized protein n=1 Tax=Bursaphelenchus xylophilus TaxID=6326 RepID=A0A1I7S5V2_BURXY
MERNTLYLVSRPRFPGSMLTKATRKRLERNANLCGIAIFRGGTGDVGYCMYFSRIFSDLKLIVEIESGLT